MDEHVRAAVTQGLRRRGIDVLTVQGAEALSASDAEHLAFARSQGRVLVTQDTDFLRLHAAGVSHTGIVYAPQSRTVGEIIHGLLLIAQVFTPGDLIDHLEYL